MNDNEVDFLLDEVGGSRRLTALGRGYSVFVKMLKLVLSVAFVVIIGIIISYLSGTDTTSLLEKSKVALANTVPGQIEVDGAKYEGADSKGNPYTITADKVNRSTTREDGVLVDNPITDITLDNKTWVALKAAGGFFNKNDNSIMLEGDVKAYHDSGYEILMHDIVINLKDKSGSTASPVIVQGPLGTARANNMEVKPNLDIIILGGPLTVTINDLSLVKG